MGTDGESETHCCLAHCNRNLSVNMDGWIHDTL